MPAGVYRNSAPNEMPPPVSTLRLKVVLTHSSVPKPMKNANQRGYERLPLSIHDFNNESMRRPKIEVFKAVFDRICIKFLNQEIDISGVCFSIGRFGLLVCDCPQGDMIKSPLTQDWILDMPSDIN